MNMLFVLIIMSLCFLAGCIFVFFWAIKSKQFKELEIQGFSVLQNDEYESEHLINSEEQE